MVPPAASSGTGVRSPGRRRSRFGATPVRRGRPIGRGYRGIVRTRPKGRASRHREKWVVVCGGLSGVMKAAAHGANEAGGVAIGILPDEDRRRANEYHTYSNVTGKG